MLDFFCVTHTRSGWAVERTVMEVDSVAYNGDIFRVGDDVELYAADDNYWYGRIKKLKKSKSVERMKVVWYYRPEDTVGGRQPFHGSHELFTSGMP